MVLLLFFIYLVPVVFVFCIVLKLGLWLAINLIQLAVWLLKHAFVLLWKLLVFVAVLVFASLRSSPPCGPRQACAPPPRRNKAR